MRRRLKSQGRGSYNSSILHQLAVTGGPFPPGANPDWTIPQGFERYGEADHRIWTTRYQSKLRDLIPRAAPCDFANRELIVTAPRAVGFP
jgi:phenylalanine-4-hydroxylase